MGALPSMLLPASHLLLIDSLVVGGVLHLVPASSRTHMPYKLKDISQSTKQRLNGPASNPG
jgi:hypothetical protein